MFINSGSYAYQQLDLFLHWVRQEALVYLEAWRNRVLLHHETTSTRTTLYGDSNASNKVTLVVLHTKHMRYFHITCDPKAETKRGQFNNNSKKLLRLNLPHSLHSSWRDFKRNSLYLLRCAFLLSSRVSCRFCWANCFPRFAPTDIWKSYTAWLDE